MQLPGYAGYPNGMPGQQRPHMGMPQGTMAQGNMGMPQGPMSPVLSGVGNMQPPQVLTHLSSTDSVPQPVHSALSPASAAADCTVPVCHCGVWLMQICMMHTAIRHA